MQSPSSDEVREVVFLDTGRRQAVGPPARHLSAWGQTA